MLFIPFSLIPFIVAAGVAIGLLRLAIWVAPKILRAAWRNVSFVVADQPVRPINKGLDRLNPLRFGQSATPATSLNTILLHTTVGMRIWALAFNLFVNYFLWVSAKGEILPEGLPTLALSLFGAITCYGLFAYEARLDDDRLTIRKWGVFHREYLWRDLTDIKDDGHYEYILDFSGKTVRMPKHLVGIQGFLTFVDEVITGNRTRNARTARS